MEETKRCTFCDELIRVNAIKCRHCGSIVSSDSDRTIITKNPDTLVKQMLGENYEVREVVGKGGMALVYRAVQKSLQREVALKVVHQNLIHDSEFISRFLREAQVGASLNHPNIVTIYDVGSLGPVHYMAMEFLSGITLREVIHQKGRLSIEDTLKHLLPISRALAYIHSRNLVHRDIKSSNVIVTPKGTVLTDFGIVFVRGEERLSTLGSVVGTPEYMSPEQAKGQEEVDHRADIYSLGVMFFEALTGQVPFHNENPLATVNSLLHDAVPSPQSINPEIPDWLNELILACLEKDKEIRIQDCNLLVECLNKKSFSAAKLSTVVKTGKTKSGGQRKTAESKRQKKKKHPVLIILIILLLTGAGGAAYLYTTTDVVDNYLLWTTFKDGDNLEKSLKYEEALLLYITSLEKYPDNSRLKNKVSSLRNQLKTESTLDQSSQNMGTTQIAENNQRSQPKTELDSSILQNKKAIDESSNTQGLTVELIDEEEMPVSQNSATVQTQEKEPQIIDDKDIISNSDQKKAEDRAKLASTAAEKPLISKKKNNSDNSLVVDKGVSSKAEAVLKPTTAKNVPVVPTKVNNKLPSDYIRILKDFGIELVFVPGLSNGFYIGKYEVTQATWEKFFGSNPSVNKVPDHPVENINMREIAEFLERVNQITNLSFRLPTEKEWMAAAYGGHSTKYSGGDRIDQYAWYEANSSGSHVAVGRLAPNELGIYDMCGNVAELCAENIKKGGSYTSTTNLCEISASRPFSTETRDWTVGLRLCLRYEE